MGRSPCCAKEGLNRGAWTAMEDRILIEYIKVHGEGRWRNLPKRAGLKRCGKSCRLRWLNYLRPDIKRGNIAPDEEELIIRLHKLLGNRWSLIAGRLPGRTDNEIKNYWNTNLGKRVNQLDQTITTTTTTSKHPKKPLNDEKNKKMATVTRAIESNVVRTKAVRCTKVFINLQPQIQPISTNHAKNTIDYNNEVRPPSPVVGYTGNFSTILEENSKVTSDLMEDDFNMGDFNLISELLNSDFSDIGHFSNMSSGNASDLSPRYNPPEQPSLFTQQLLEDWLGYQQI